MGVCCLAFTLRSLQSSKNVTWAIEVSNNISSTLSTPSCLLLLPSSSVWGKRKYTEIFEGATQVVQKSLSLFVMWQIVTFVTKKVTFLTKKGWLLHALFSFFRKKNCCWKIVTFEAVKPCQKITSKTVPPLVPECQLCSQIESRKKEIQNNEVWICILNPYCGTAPGTVT